jgi:hypothetical protein
MASSSTRSSPQNQQAVPCTEPSQCPLQLGQLRRIKWQQRQLTKKSTSTSLLKATVSSLVRQTAQTCRVAATSTYQEIDQHLLAKGHHIIIGKTDSSDVSNGSNSNLPRNWPAAPCTGPPFRPLQAGKHPSDGSSASGGASSDLDSNCPFLIHLRLASASKLLCRHATATLLDSDSDDLYHHSLV